MNVMPIGSASNVYYKELVFLESRLGAEEKTKHLKVVVTAQRSKFDEIWRAEREIEFDVADTQAQAKTVDERLKDSADEVYASTLHLVKLNRKDARYKKICVMSPSTFKKLAFQAKREEFLRIREVLELDMYEDAFRDAMTLVIDRSLGDIAHILGLQKQLERKRVFYRQDVEAFKAETNQVRSDVYGELILLSDTPGEGWARGFFPLQKKVKVLSEEEKALKEEKRLERRAKEAAAKLGLEEDNLERAREKSRIVTAKAEAEDKERQASKERAEKRQLEKEELAKKEQEKKEQEKKDGAVNGGSSLPALTNPLPTNLLNGADSHGGNERQEGTDSV